MKKNKRKSLAKGGNIAGKGFNINPWLMGAQAVMKTAGAYSDAINYKPTLGAEKSAPGVLDFVKNPLGFGAELIKFNKDKNTVVSGSPGAYATGGYTGGPTDPPIYQPIVTNGQPNMATSTAMIESNNPYGLPNNDPALARVQMATEMNVPTDLLEMNQTGKMENRSYPNRFRERANGGSIDSQLSQDSFQVNGNPQVTDGNEYDINGQPVKLDHGEVVDVAHNFVYSDDLKVGKESFADIAKKPTKAIGKAEKVLQRNPYDMEAKKTIEYSKKSLQGVASAQEKLATMLGLRENESEGYAAGGYYQGDPTNPFDPFNPYNRQGPLMQFGPVSTVPIPTQPVAAKPVPAGTRAPAKARKTPIVPEDISKGPVTSNLGTGISIPTASTRTYQSISNRDVFGQKTAPTATTEYYQTNSSNPDKIEPLPLRSLGMQQKFPYPTDVPFEERPYEGTNLKASTTDPDISRLKVSQDSIDAQRGSTRGGLGENNFTLGDYLQMAEVGSKFFQTLKGPEKEKQMFDTTRITRNTYDPRPQLQQNERNFRNTINNIDSPSLNTRRAITNSLQANKMNSDSQVLSNAEMSNKQLNSQYENQVSNQRRYNIQSAQYTNNLNAANRGAYDSVVQNAYTSVGNFGEALNRKKYGKDSLKVLEQRYPKVYADLIAELFGKQGTETTAKIKTTYGK